MKIRTRQSGDTIIEVLVAMVVLSLVVTTSYNIMNRTYSYGQVALERTSTQAMLSGQAAMLRDAQSRYLRANGIGPLASDWAKIIQETTGGFMNTTAMPTATDTGCTAPSFGNKAFYFDPSTGVAPAAYLDTLYTRQAASPTYGDGMWIEGYSVPAEHYYDFYLKACWDTPFGGSQQAMVTTVRLYEAN